MPSWRRPVAVGKEVNYCDGRRAGQVKIESGIHTPEDNRMVWGHLALGLNLSMPSVVGFVSLAGIVVNNAILLVEFIKFQRRAAQRPVDAAVHTAKMKFRAIPLAPTTTIIGLLPPLSETSHQAQILEPLVTNLAFGLFTVTLLIFSPVQSPYTIFDKFGWTAK
ncbi:MAG: efflux RND transporter permease subunit [Rhodospirillales bacterium]|nr:efflux RND transporter permease subunit [Rhodospirillales bacterium]